MKQGVIFCGHGTKSEQGISAFFKIYRALEQKLAGNFFLSYGFIEQAEPSLQNAIESHIKNGVNEIIILPALLFSGVHTTHDIPFIAQSVSNANPQVHIKLATTLNLSEQVIEICLQQIEEQLSQTDGVATNKHLLVVGVGSSKPEANIKIASLARILWENLPFKQVSYSFISRMTFPSVSDELEGLKQRGADNVIILPVILFPGVYLDKIALLVENFKQSFNGKVQVCNPFDENEWLFDAFIQRLNEVLEGKQNLLAQANIIQSPRK